MKTSRYIIAMAAILLAASCSKEIEQQGTKLTITASFADARAKTTLQDGGTTVYWEPGDEIKVFLDGESGRFASTATENVEVSKFKGSISAVIGGGEGYFADSKLLGLYPYRADATSDGTSITTTLSNEQTGRAGSFAKNTNITISTSNTTALAFYNVCGGVRFSLTQEGISKVVFQGQNDEDIAGIVKVAFENGIPVVEEISSGQKTITLSAPDGTFEVGKWYYIVSLPASLSKGFILTFVKGGKTAEFKKSTAAEIKRGIFGSLQDVDKDVHFPPEKLEAVDLGLSVSWASMNVGAESEEEIGYRVAWGETVPKSSYTWSNYKWCNGSYNNLTKYCTNSSYGTYDGKNILDDDDDVAIQTWGSEWRTPSRVEMQELFDDCTWRIETLKGQQGQRVTGPNGNSIFIPFNGQMDEGGLHWTDELYLWTNECNSSYYGYVGNISSVSDSNHRHDGLCVRAVYGSKTTKRTDLSASGTANCYIVSKAGDYKFIGTVKGNSSESVGTPSSVSVLWESFGNNVTPNEGDIISSVSFSDGYVFFTTPAELANGNAVIAVRDASNNILWSWHIWVCKDFDPVASAQTYNNSAGTMMDRNLGATSATPGDVGALGLLYQWGRKDPFLSGQNTTNSITAASNYEWPSAITSNSTYGNISYTVSHPTTIIIKNSKNGDWLYTGTSNVDNTRWTTLDKDKTMYDPCPQGWRVPNGGDDGVWSIAFGSDSYLTDGPWDSNKYGMNFGSENHKTSSMQLGTSSSIWYPASGDISEETGLLKGVGTEGHCWACVNNSSYLAIPFSYFVSHVMWGSKSVLPDGFDNRAHGHSVRCCKEIRVNRE